MAFTLQTIADGEAWPKREFRSIAEAKFHVLTMMKAGCRGLTAEVVDEAGEVVAYKPEHGGWVRGVGS